MTVPVADRTCLARCPVSDQLITSLNKINTVLRGPDGVHPSCGPAFVWKHFVSCGNGDCGEFPSRAVFVIGLFVGILVLTPRVVLSLRGVMLLKLQETIGTQCLHEKKCRSRCA